LIVGRADKLFFGRRSLPGHVFTLENGYHFSVTILSHFVVSDSVWKWIHGLGGPGLILLGLSDNTPFVSAPPGSVDVCVILLAAHRPEWWAYYAFMTTVGEVLGGYLTYRLSKKGGKQTLERKVGKQRAEMVYRGFEKFGSITVLAGALLPPPFPFTSVLMTAGVMQYPRKKFLPALMVGRAVRYFAESWLGRIYGQQMIGFFSRNYRSLVYLLIAIAGMAGIGALVYFVWYRPRKKRKERGQNKQS
jgi:membrane protein YqaA with SNARE-associated domain